MAKEESSFIDVGTPSTKDGEDGGGDSSSIGGDDQN